MTPEEKNKVKMIIGPLSEMLAKTIPGLNTGLARRVLENLAAVAELYEQQQGHKGHSNDKQTRVA
jgi:hypothetical protein